MDSRFGIPPFGLRGFGFRDSAFVERGHDGGWPDALSWAIFALLLALLAIAAALLVLDLLARTRRGSPRLQPASAPLAALDLRYARGEIDREAYLRARADLGGEETPTKEIRPQPEPPPEGIA